MYIHIYKKTNSTVVKISLMVKKYSSREKKIKVLEDTILFMCNLLKKKVKSSKVIKKKSIYFLQEIKKIQIIRNINRKIIQVIFILIRKKKQKIIIIFLFF